MRRVLGNLLEQGSQVILPKRRQTADDLVVGLRVVPPPLLQSVLGHARKLFFRPRHPRSGRGDQGTFQDCVAQHAGTKIELNVVSTRNRGSARCTLPSSRIVRRTEGTRHGRKEAREREREAREGGGEEGREVKGQKVVAGGIHRHTSGDKKQHVHTTPPPTEVLMKTSIILNLSLYTTHHNIPTFLLLGLVLNVTVRGDAVCMCICMSFHRCRRVDV